MNRAKIVLGLSLLILVTVVAGLDYRFSIIVSCPRVPGDELAPPQSVFRLLIQPDRLQDYALKHYGEAVPIPKWLVTKVLPYEISIFMDPDVSVAQTRVFVYANERRLGRIFVNAVNQSGALSRIPDVTWQPPGLVREKRGKVWLEGTVPIPPDPIKTMRTEWGIISPFSPILMKNEHAVEALLDMRDGRGFLLLSDWFGRNAPPGSELHPDQLVPIARNIATVWISANVVPEETLSVRVVVECRPEASDSDAGSIAFLMNYISAELNRTLKRVCKAELSGTAEASGIQVTGDYQLAPLENLLRGLGMMQ